MAENEAVCTQIGWHECPMKVNWDFALKMSGEKLNFMTLTHRISCEKSTLLSQEIK